MNIHTVKPGDTIFKIARKYSVSPMKIIENNDLQNPDRLSVGQELLILTPTRTYTVRGSDTLRRISDRFGVKYETLLANNPYLAGGDKLYPGQLLAIKYDTPKYGALGANGYYYRGCSDDRLSMALPYMSNITVAVGKRDGNDIRLSFDDTDVLKMARERRVPALMRIFDTEYDNFSDAYIDNLILMAKSRGYDGVNLASYNAVRENPTKYAEFLNALKKRLTDAELELFLELDGNSPINLPDVADGYSVMYEKCCFDDIPDFENGEKKTFEAIGKMPHGAKCYMELPSFGYMGDEPITKKEAERIAHSAALEIKNDKDKGINHFEYNKYKAGKRETVRVAYESTENIRQKLDLIGKLGLMGICFDIMNIPVEYLMMIETEFCRLMPRLSN